MIIEADKVSHNQKLNLNIINTIYGTPSTLRTPQIYFFQRDFREITEADDVDKKTMAAMKKNAARDNDII